MGEIDPEHGPITITEDPARVKKLFTVYVAVLVISTVLYLPFAGSARIWYALAMGVIIILFIGLWIYSARHPARIEVTRESIRFVRRNGRDGAVLSRRHKGRYDDAVSIKRVRRGRSNFTALTLVDDFAAPVIPLNFFSRDAIVQACHERNWRLTGRI